LAKIIFPTPFPTCRLNSVFDASVNGYGPANAKSYADGSISLVIGNTIDFAVGPGGNGYDFDTTGLAAQINGVPLPGAVLLLGSGLLGLAGCGRRFFSRN